MKKLLPQCSECQKPTIKLFIKGEFICHCTRIFVDCLVRDQLSLSVYSVDEIEDFISTNTAKHFLENVGDDFETIYRNITFRREIKNIENSEVQLILAGIKG